MMKKITLWVSFLVACGVSLPVHADSKKKFMDALGKESTGLLGKGLKAEVKTGVWWVNLDPGLLGALEGLTESSPENAATQSIGSGQGLVKQIGFSIETKDNYLALDYLSDRLFSFIRDEAEERVENPQLRGILEQFIGELRPDLSSLADIDGQVWFRGEYGIIQGDILDPSLFLARDGVPYFPGKDEGWETRFFSLEAGVAYNDKDENGFAWFGRYRNFSRPLILGIASEVDGNTTDLHLQDGAVRSFEFGGKAIFRSCETLCSLYELSLVPFTGYTMLDFGNVGWVGVLTFSTSANVEFSYPFNLWEGGYIAPYAGFRAELLMPIGTDLSAGVGEVFGGGELESLSITIGNPDYLFWGPTGGVRIRL